MFDFQKTKENTLLTLSLKLSELALFFEKKSEYQVREFSSGDDSYWELIAKDYYKEFRNFDKEMKFDCAFREDRIFFIFDKEHPIATASAWYRPEWGIKTGYIHAVFALTSYKNKEVLLYAILSALEKTKKEGREYAIAQLQDFRLEEIAAFIELGFKPLLLCGSHKSRWEKVLNVLKRTDLKKYIENERLNGHLTPDFGKIDRDTKERTEIRQRWNPNREHRDVGGSVDALADESLYRPSKLGKASVEPNTALAGSNLLLKLKYVAGDETIEKGTRVIFSMRGQKPLGCNFQVNDSKAPGYIEIKAPQKCKIKGVCEGFMNVGFQIEEGLLLKGDIVEMLLGAPNGFKLTPLAGSYEFKVTIDNRNGQNSKRLPEPVVIEVTPDKFHHLDVMLPCTRSSSRKVNVRISARDVFDNRVNYNLNSRHILYLHRFIKFKCFVNLFLFFRKRKQNSIFTYLLNS